MASSPIGENLASLANIGDPEDSSIVDKKCDTPSEEPVPDDNFSEDQVDTVNVDTQYDMTFPTNADGMNLFVSEEESLRSASRSSTILSKEKFIQLMEKGQTKPKGIRNSRSQLRQRTMKQPLTPTKVAEICKDLMEGKSVIIDDFGHLQDVLNEFARRRQAFMEKSEYLKSKKIDDICAVLKRQFATKDVEESWKESLNQAQERHQQAKEALERTKAEWKQKEQELKDKQKQEDSDLVTKFVKQDEELEAKWLDPSIQRRYNKQSKLLLQQRAREKYMVLSGQLEDAEELKKLNKETEKKESQEKHSAMQASYDADCDRLADEQDEEKKALDELHQFQLRAFLISKEEAIELAERRVKNAQLMEEEISSFEAFYAKTKSLNATTVPVVATPQSLQQSKSLHAQGEGPLPLPPLQTKNKKRRGKK